jgi:hypothetical protein
MANAAYCTPGFLLTAQANLRHPAGNYQIVLLNDSIRQISIIAGDVSGSTITKTAHGFVNGQAVQTNAGLGTNWPADNTRYVVNAAADTFQVALEPGGTALSLTGATATIRDLPIVNPLLLNPAQSAIPNYRSPWSNAAIFSKEIANYDDLLTRPQVTLGTAASFATYNHATASTRLTLAEITLDNTGGAITIQYNAVAILTGGSTTPGNTTGTILSIVAFPGFQEIGQDVARVLQYGYTLFGTGAF